MNYKAAYDRLAVVIFIVVAMAGCMKKELEPVDVPSRDKEIRFKANFTWDTKTQAEKGPYWDLRSEHQSKSGNAIVLHTFFEDISVAQFETKVSPVTSMSSFNVGATIGSGGSESSVWNNVSFSGSTTYTGGKVWPATDPSYHFYASNSSMTFNESGTTVNVTNNTDVLCAYISSPVFRDSNTLTFDHVLSRIGNVTVSSVDSDVSLSDVSVTITPKISGTYNIRTGAWSSSTVGSPIQLANSTGGEKLNDFWLLPDSYTVTCSWTASKGANSQDFDGWEGVITIPAGKVVSFSISMGGPAGVVLKTFAGMYIAPGDLYYDGSEYQISDDWDAHSYQVSKGKVSGSYLHSYDEMSDVFSTVNAKRGSNTNIDNNKTIPYQNMAWRMMSTDDRLKIFGTGTSRRNGSTVNGTANRHYAILRLTGYTNGNISNPYVLLAFPDDEVITTSRSLTYMDSNTTNTNVTQAQLQEYLDAGCVAFLASGRCYNNTYSQGSSNGNRWLSNSYSSNNGYYFYHGNNSLNQGNISKNTYWFSVRCVTVPIEVTSPAATLWKGENITYTAISNVGTVLWTSSDVTVATVNSLTGEVHAVGPGEAEIIATAGSKSARQKVYVNRITGISLSTTSLNNSNKSSYANLTATAAINGGGAVYGSPGTITINYSSSNTDIATVSSASNTSGTSNRIDYITMGTAIITALIPANTYGDNSVLSATCTVTLNPWVTIVNSGFSNNRELYLWCNDYYASGFLAILRVEAWGGVPVITTDAPSGYVSVSSAGSEHTHNKVTYRFELRSARSGNFAGEWSVTATLGSESDSVPLYVNHYSYIDYETDDDYDDVIVQGVSFFYGSYVENEDPYGGSYEEEIYHGYYAFSTKFELTLTNQLIYYGSSRQGIPVVCDGTLQYTPRDSSGNYIEVKTENIYVVAFTDSYSWYSSWGTVSCSYNCNDDGGTYNSSILTYAYDISYEYMEYVGWIHYLDGRITVRFEFGNQIVECERYYSGDEDSCISLTYKSNI